jgi:hypothetical protein
MIPIVSYNLPGIATRALVSLLVCLACVFVGYRHGKEVMRGRWDASTVASREAQDKALSAAADRIAQITVKNQTIVQRIERETIEKPVFRDCRSGADAVRLLNSAAGHGSIEPAGQSELPASAPAG